MGRRAVSAELPERKFSGTVRVGADIIRPPTWQVFEQKRIGPVG